jgi:hypothetical protein
MVYWSLPNGKSYVRIDRNGLNTAMGELILKCFYPKKYSALQAPIEERHNFIEWAKTVKNKIIKGIPTGVTAINPDLEYFFVEGSTEWQCFNKLIPPHFVMPIASEQEKGVPHALVRHPVDRFKSFINKYTLELHTYVESFDITRRLDEIFTSLQNLSPTDHFMYGNKLFMSQVSILENNFAGIKMYKYAEHASNLVADLGLTEQPEKHASTLIQSFQLAPAHEDIINAKYGADLDLYNSIQYPGLIVA